jgi:hypothetical protein
MFQRTAVAHRGQRATHIAIDGANERVDASSGFPQQAQACESMRAG